MALPKFLQSFLPSYDISKMDLHDPDDKKLIIEAILNRGSMKDIKWLFSTYSLKEVKDVVRHPSRGCWDPRALNYWTKMFNIKLKPIIKEVAIIDLRPNLKKWQRWFQYVKKQAPKETQRRWKKLGLLKNPSQL